MSKNIVLIGFMGAGKSTVARKLAEELKRETVSTDDLIVKREGRSINDIFKDSGEAYFRSLEKTVVAEVSQENNLIIDCGGGVVLNLENVANLKKNGIIFYLSASVEAIYQRIKDQTHRPLLKADNPKAKIQELLNSRQSQYQGAAHYTLDASPKPIDPIVDAIKKIMAHE